MPCLRPTPQAVGPPRTEWVAILPARLRALLYSGRGEIEKSIAQNSFRDIIVIDGISTEECLFQSRAWPRSKVGLDGRSLKDKFELLPHWPGWPAG